MNWFKKTFPRLTADWAADQVRFTDLQLAIAADGTDTYRKMMMLTVDADGELPETEDVFLYLPDTRAHLFPGYQRTEAPSRVTGFLVSDQHERERLFGRSALTQI
jgi:hypothetical protein